MEKIQSIGVNEEVVQVEKNYISTDRNLFKLATSCVRHWQHYVFLSIFTIAKSIQTACASASILV